MQKEETRYRVIKNRYGYYESEVKHWWFPFWVSFISDWENTEELAWARIKEDQRLKQNTKTWTDI